MQKSLRIAHMAWPTATIENTPSLVTSNKAREKRGIPARLPERGTAQRFDALPAQRLAAPAKVYVERFCAHPLDRLGIGVDGLAGTISALAHVDFHRVLPPGGYTHGLAKSARTDTAEGDIAPERQGHDFFAYQPYHIPVQPVRPVLARITNRVQTILADDRYDGAIWTQGSPSVEGSAYWFNLLIDTRMPIACNGPQRPKGQMTNDAPQNILAPVRSFSSSVWDVGSGRNRLGTRPIQEQQFFAAREVAKGDARPGGYVATVENGGILRQISHQGSVAVTYLPACKQTHCSDVRPDRRVHCGVRRLSMRSPRDGSIVARRTDTQRKDQPASLVSSGKGRHRLHVSWNAAGSAGASQREPHTPLLPDCSRKDRVISEPVARHTLGCLQM